ncbi:hypothetical protein F9278_27570 [Streptomyces phaeolivaceus]|uniref:Uncharacterized protein n=1 Tax=Streptomyces phaeolivaceus TaxID=2653200 RepID=A0A5P8K853_9ACTN|nr:hypothetical protein [Streptomyces phaeolivaceus]QFQ99281.1 hypothetical protein F9278_27570 [Streptomyces phaeolivaceus]
MADEANLIDPSGIPQFLGDLSTLGIDVMLLYANAGQFRASGADLHTAFQGLSAVYQAPEAHDLVSSTQPVKTKTDAFADDLEKVAAALDEYGVEVRPLVEKLATLKTDAQVFVDSVAGDDDWRKDKDKVETNNGLWHDVNKTVAAFQAAERACHNKITALVGGTKLSVDDGSHGENMYGYRAEDLDHAGETPWGAAVEQEYEGWDWFTHTAGQVWDGFWTDGVMGTVHGVGTLFGADGSDAAGEAWKGLAKLGTASFLTSATLGTWWLVPDDKLPSWLRDSRTTYKQTVKGFVAWDTWQTNPARAAGTVSFNVLGLLGTEGAGAAATSAGRTGAAARAVSVVGKVGRAVDPFTYVGKAGKFAYVKVGDAFTALKNLKPGAYLDMAGNGGRYTLPDQSTPLAERAAAIPEHAAEYVDQAGKRVYLDTKTGDVLNADGSIRQYADEAPHELSANDHTELNRPAHADRPRDLAEVGARAEHARGGNESGYSDAYAGGGGNVPGPRGDHGPGSDGWQAGAGDEPHPVGKDWYDQLEPHQIKDVQVYRANHEPGYFEKYYRENGRRLRVAVADESGYPPPHLKKDPNHPGSWIAATDKPPPFPEKYVPGSKVARAPDTVPTDRGLDTIKDAAHQRHISVQADNAWHEPVRAAKGTYEAAPTPDNLRAYEEVKAGHAPFHEKMSVDSEAFGEAVARHHVIPEHYQGYQWEKLSGPKNGNDQFDQLWSHTDTNGVKKFVVIEAKGSSGLDLGKRELPNGFDARQGSKEYFQDILRKMRERGLDGDTNEMLLYRELRKSLRQGNVEYVLVKAKSTASGEYAGYAKWTFDIS